MANTIFRSSSDYQIVRAFQVLGLLCLTLLVQKSCATNFTIGGSIGKLLDKYIYWSVPEESNASQYNRWAENNRFQIGDSIVFVYPADNDSVLLVSQDDYNNCKTDHPLQKFDDGYSVFIFNRSGPHYFISGNKNNCVKNEKVTVTVLSERNHTNSTSPSPAPAPPSTPSSPAPSSQEFPSPPIGTVEINPVPAPVGEPTPSKWCCFCEHELSWVHW